MKSWTVGGRWGVSGEYLSERFLFLWRNDDDDNDAYCLLNGHRCGPALCLGMMKIKLGKFLCVLWPWNPNGLKIDWENTFPKENQKNVWGSPNIFSLYILVSLFLLLCFFVGPFAIPVTMTFEIPKCYTETALLVLLFVVIFIIAVIAGREGTGFDRWKGEFQQEYVWDDGKPRTGILRELDRMWLVRTMPSICKGYRIASLVQKMLPLQNYNSSVFLVHMPSVILAWEEAAELEIVNAPKQMWPGMKLQKHKRAACWHGNRLRAETTEAEVEQCQPGMCGLPWVCFGGLGKTAPQINSPDLRSKTGTKETALSNLARLKSFLVVNLHCAYLFVCPAFHLNTIKINGVRSPSPTPFWPRTFFFFHCFLNSAQ